MQTFRKNERLANYRLQKMLFSKGSTFFQYPLRIHWLGLSAEDLNDMQPVGKPIAASACFRHPVKCLVSVSKRQIRKSVHRNHIKRLIREAYRKNKNCLYAFLNTGSMVVLLAVIYTAKSIMTYSEIELALQKAMDKLSKKLKTPDVEKRLTE